MSLRREIHKGNGRSNANPQREFGKFHSSTRITPEQIRRDMEEYAKKNPNGVRSYYSLDYLEKIAAERDARWKRGIKIKWIKRAAIGVIGAMLAFYFATSSIGVRVLPNSVSWWLHYAISEYLYMTKYRNDPQLEVLKLRREHSKLLRKKERSEAENERLKELVQLMELEDHKAMMRLLDKYSGIKLGDIKSRCEPFFNSNSVYRNFFSNFPDSDNLTVGEFYWADPQNRGSIYYLLLDFERNFGYDKEFGKK